MWFEHAIFKEKLKFMFNNELSIEHVELDTVLYYSISMLRVRLNSRVLPAITPEKWRGINYNSLSITLEFGNVKQFECKGGDIGFECCPIITPTKEKTTLQIMKGNFILYCEADFMTIKDIIPFIDTRFDC
ncbi:Imm50 family immunity protein [Scandinavium lactucae]|uniref:Imm50 family immunity protein n=1 Tax=Scandinavium lactucae TaxID=3095028 RepID=A0ABU4QPG2_9ENTR|nr:MULTISPECIES: Imm50 family immunity protein [unclassified Scandinavium]MDX6040034.1 Imm50 family immunity protein [Scandinavium sp. V105_6]MDX6049508.1 Imm50 family immunity protein [Scandinavium sp. V105_1]